MRALLAVLFLTILMAAMAGLIALALHYWLDLPYFSVGKGGLFGAGMGIMCIVALGIANWRQRRVSKSIVGADRQRVKSTKR